MLEQKYRLRDPVFNLRSPLPLVGWALVIGSLISYGYLLLPFKLMDAAWEFGVMGPLVDNSLLCLLGMGLVLHERPQAMVFQQLVALRALLVLGCLLGFCYLAMIPLALSDEQRLETKQDSQFTSAGALNSDRVEKIQGTLKNVKTIQDLKSLGSMLNLVPTPGERKALQLDKDFDQFYKWTERQIMSGLNRQKIEALQQHERNLARLQKDGIHVILGASLAGISYCLICSMNFILFREHVIEPENPERES